MCVRDSEEEMCMCKYRVCVYECDACMCVYMCVEERYACMPVIVRMHESEREKRKTIHRALYMCVYVYVSAYMCSRCLCLSI
jgi:hypothetical protein